MEEYVPLSYTETVQIQEVADSTLLHEIDALSSDASINEEIENEVYALIHFGDTKNHLPCKMQKNWQNTVNKNKAVKEKNTENKNTENNLIQHSSVCYQCKRVGHLSNNCNEYINAKCNLCGSPAHKSNQCKQRVCTLCNSISHEKNACTKKKNSNIICPSCNSQTHMLVNCNVYRKEVEISKNKVCVSKSCCFCGSDQHMLSECKDMPDSSITTFYTTLDKYNENL